MTSFNSIRWTAAAALLLVQAATAQPPSEGGEAARGQALYARFGCYECHQYSGAGYQGAPGGAQLVPLPLTLEAFKLYLRNPPVPRRMPPYTAKVLNDSDLAAIYAFIRSLPEPPPVAEIPLLAKIAAEIEAGAGRPAAAGTSD
jgi:hypothetical protein